jgi:exonuclease III
MCLKLSTWNVSSLYSAGSLRAARELARYKLDFVGVDEVRWDKGGTTRAGDCIFLRQKKRKSSNGNRISYTPQNSIGSTDSRGFQ